MNSAAFETIRAVLMQRFALSEEELTPERPLVSLGLDSLAVIELVFELESILHIGVPELPPDVDTLARLAGFIDGLPANAPGDPVGPSHG